MGSCVNSEQSDVAKPITMPQDEKMSEGVSKPLFSTLYNLLRRRSEIEIIRSQTSLSPLFEAEMQYDFSSLKPRDIKLLCGGKNILLLSPEDIVITQIMQSCSPKSIYVISEDEAKIFLQDFPIFKSNSGKSEPRILPILVANVHEFCINSPKRSIYLHSERYRNDEVYEKLSISCIVSETPTQNSSQVIKNLSQNKSGHVLYLHSASTNQEVLLDILSEFLASECHINKPSARKYITNIFPNMKGKENINKFKSEHVLEAGGGGASLKENFETYLEELFLEMGGDQANLAKIERSYNLIINLVSNIYNNKESDNFRKVRKTNKQVNDLLGKYVYGVKLLQEAGFFDEEGFYVNSLDGKYLKVYRTDIDLAFKRFMSIHSK